MARVALVDCLHLPEPDPDREVLSSVLAEAGVDSSWAAWDDPAIDWSAYHLIVVRAAWNYFEQLEQFLPWADRCGERLLNPPDVIRWNAHKSYLLDLASRGVHTVPTELAARGDRISLREIAERRGWRKVVLKPAVSAASFGTHLFEEHDFAKGDQVLAAMLAERDMMVQPYVTSVESYGERALIYIDGQITHAIRKSPRFSGGSEQVSGPLPIAPDERAFAEAALAPFADRILYGRVDLARDDRDSPMIMELELIEPSLFLLQHRPARERLAAAIARRIS